MNELITQKTEGYELTRKSYHDTKDLHIEDDSGRLTAVPLLSSTGIKSMYKGGWSRGTNATAIGNDIHEMMQALMLGQDFHVELAPAKKGSVAHTERTEELAKLYGDNFRLCNNTDFKKIMPELDKAKAFVSTLGAVKKYPEAMAFVSADHIKAHTPSEEFAEIHEWIKESGCAVKCAADLLVEQIDGTLKLYDYKRTAKTNLRELTGQINALNYPFSLFFYRYVLHLVGVKVHPVCTLLVMNEGLDMYVPVKVDTSAAQVAQKYYTPYYLKSIQSQMNKQLDLVNGTAHTLHVTDCDDYTDVFIESDTDEEQPNELEV